MIEHGSIRKRKKNSNGNQHLANYKNKTSNWLPKPILKKYGCYSYISQANGKKIIWTQIIMLKICTIIRIQWITIKSNLITVWFQFFICILFWSLFLLWIYKSFIKFWFLKLKLLKNLIQLFKRNSFNSINSNLTPISFSMK